MKYIKVSVITVFAFLFLSCIDEEVIGIEKILIRNQSILFIDYSSLPAGSLPSVKKYFNEEHPAKMYLPDWLSSVYFMAEDSSSLVVKYAYYNPGRPAYLDQFNSRTITLDYLDYKAIWGLPYVNSLCPSKDPELNIPSILKQKNPTAKEGDKQLVEYMYSDKEPYTVKNVPIYYLKEDFSNANADINNLTGWENISRNITRTWKLRLFGSNARAMATANGVSQPRYTKLDSWLITKEMDLTQAVNPIFSFEMGMGYYSNQNFFSVYVSSEYKTDKVIDLNEWEDISHRLNLPQNSPSTGYGPLEKYGEIDLKDYVGKKIRIGFRYTGQVDLQLNRSTTYELDNILVHETADQTLIQSTRPVAEIYAFSDGNWKPETGSVYVLQPEDYTTLNVNYIEKHKAATLIPAVLKLKNGLSTTDNIIVVYKTGIAGLVYADEFRYIAGLWVQVSPIDVIERQDVYIFSEKSWKYQNTLN